MRRLDRYMLRESLPPFLFGLMLYSSLAVMSANFARLQWIVGTPLLELFYWLILQFPTAIVQTLPIALLLAVLLAFGRLATSNELLAMQAGGVALRQLSALLLAFGLLAAGFALAMNQWVLPQTNVRVGSLWWELTSGSSGLYRLQGQSLPIGDYRLSFGVVTSDDELQGVRLEAWQDRELNVVLAERARLTEQKLILYDYQMARLDLAALKDEVPESSDVLLANLVKLNNPSSSPEATLTLTLPEDRDALITRYSGGGFEDSRSISQTRQDAADPRLSPTDRRAAAVLFHRKLAEPFANLTLLAIALPLAVLHARSRSVAFGLSLSVTLAWYLLLTLGQLLAQAGVIPVWFGLWFGNALLLVLGLYLIYSRTNFR